MGTSTFLVKLQGVHAHDATHYLEQNRSTNLPTGEQASVDVHGGLSAHIL